MTKVLTQALGALVTEIGTSRPPEDALDVVRLGFIDAFGVMIAGAGEEAVRILHDAIAPARGPSTLYPDGTRIAAPEAAFINGMAAHVLDYDDVALRGHPSAALVPAILAEAEALGADGASMMRAYLAGYEVWADLVHRDPDQHHEKGWHPTGIFGAVAAAAACSVLRGLTPDVTATALALGASHSSGIMSNFGSMAKPMHAGLAARAGVVAARLAAGGFSASLDALEHPQGFLAAISPGGRVDLDSPPRDVGMWRILDHRLSIKKYPICYCAHRATDAILDLRSSHDLPVDAIAAISVSTSRRCSKLLRNSQPQTGLEAKFSMQFAIAAGLISGRVGLSELSDNFVLRADVQELMQKVTIIPDDRQDPLNGYAPEDVVIVETVAGVRIEGAAVTTPRGSATLPLDRHELLEKFTACIGSGLPEADAMSLFAMLESLDRAPGIQSLLDAFSPVPNKKTGAK